MANPPVAAQPPVTSTSPLYIPPMPYRVPRTAQPHPVRERILGWIDRHQTAVSIGIGGLVGLGMLALVIGSGGSLTPLVIAGSALLAGGLTAGGTAALNRHYDRPPTQNLLRNVGYSIGAELVTILGGGALLKGGVGKAALGVGNAVNALCVRFPAACTRAEAALLFVDRAEEWVLSGQLGIETALRLPRAAETALELQLERLDGRAPGNTTFRQVQEALSPLIRRHGDDVAQLVERFGRNGAELLARHNDDAVEFLRRHVDDARQVAGYVERVIDVDLARLNLEQSYAVSELAREFDVPITITGRWADTPAEAAWREEAHYRMQELISQGIDENSARLRSASEFGIDPHQVKTSSGGPEVDVFIPRNIWDNLSSDQQRAIRKRLIDVFNTRGRAGFHVDFYQELPLEKIALG